jgi:hypothetical protein
MMRAAVATGRPSTRSQSTPRFPMGRRWVCTLGERTRMRRGALQVQAVADDGAEFAYGGRGLVADDGVGVCPQIALRGLGSKQWSVRKNRPAER